MAEHNVDVSKLQSTTKEHADTTNTIALMHKEIEQLRVEKYVNYNKILFVKRFLSIVVYVLVTISVNRDSMQYGDMFTQVSC